MSTVGVFSEAFYTTDLSQTKDRVYLDSGTISIGSSHVCCFTASCRGWQNPHLTAVSRRIHSLLSEKGGSYESLKKHLSEDYKRYQVLKKNIAYIDSACKRGNQKFKQVQESYFWCLILKIVNCIRYLLCCETITPYPRILEDTVKTIEAESFNYSRAKHSIQVSKPLDLQQVLEMNIPRLELGHIDQAKFSLGTKVFELSYDNGSGKFNLYLTYTTRHIAQTAEFLIEVKCYIVDLNTEAIQDLIVTHTVQGHEFTNSNYDQAGITLEPNHTYVIIDENFDFQSGHDIKTYPRLACFKISKREEV